jgi:hypothetical protein
LESNDLAARLHEYSKGFLEKQLKIYIVQFIYI